MKHLEDITYPNNELVVLRHINDLNAAVREFQEFFVGAPFTGKIAKVDTIEVNEVTHAGLSKITPMPQSETFWVDRHHIRMAELQKEAEEAKKEGVSRGGAKVNKQYTIQELRDSICIPPKPTETEQVVFDVITEFINSLEQEGK